MHIGRFGSLAGFAVQVIGAGIALMYPNEKTFGVVLVLIGTVVLIVATAHGLYGHRERIRIWARRLGAPQIVLLAGLAGTWLFMTMAIGAVAWIISSGQPFTIGQSAIAAAKDEGPMNWNIAFEMEGGPLLNRPIFSLTFRGWNTTQREVELKSASIISAINGTKLPLDVAVQRDEFVPVQDIELVPAGATVPLVARFGPPAENEPGKVKGIDAKEFLETWRQFTVNIEDDTRKYRLPYNEAQLGMFFPGMAGPHVTKKVK